MLPRSHQSTKISEMAPSTSSPEKSMETGKRQRRRIVLQMLVGRWRSYATGQGEMPEMFNKLLKFKERSGRQALTCTAWKIFVSVFGLYLSMIMIRFCSCAENILLIMYFY